MRQTKLRCANCHEDVTDPKLTNCPICGTAHFEQYRPCQFTLKSVCVFVACVAIYSSLRGKISILDKDPIWMVLSGEVRFIRIGILAMVTGMGAIFSAIAFPTRLTIAVLFSVVFLWLALSAFVNALTNA